MEVIKCSNCDGEMKPTGAVTDTNPAIIHFKCDKCGLHKGIWEDELEELNVGAGIETYT